MLGSIFSRFSHFQIALVKGMMGRDGSGGEGGAEGTFFLCVSLGYILARVGPILLHELDGLERAERPSLSSDNGRCGKRRLILALVAVSICH